MNNKGNKESRFQWRIAQRFIFYILLFSSTITLILTVIQLYLDYRHGLDSIHSSIEQIEISYLDGIAKSLWVSDTELLQIQLKGMLKLNDMQYIGITHNNRTLFQVGERLNSQQISKDFSLSYTYGDRVMSLGTLHVVYTLNNLYKSLLNKTIVILVSQGIKTFLVSGFILIIFYILIARHLRRLAVYAKKLDLDHLETPFVIRNNQYNNERDEFNILAKAINEMRVNLKESYHQLQEEVIERKQAEAKTKESEEKYRRLFEIAQEGIWVIDAESNTTLVNPSMARLMGYTAEEMIGKHLYFFMDEQAKAIAEENIQRRKEGIKEQHDFEFIHKNGSRIYVTLETSPILDSNNQYMGAIAGMIDITDRKEAEDIIKASLKEKETLLHEIHHRVKNNMQVISSLLDLQSKTVKNKEAKAVLLESQSRIYMMAAVHETLHDSDSLSKMDLQNYLSKVTPAVFQTYSVEPGKVSLINEIESLPISINQASPLGLITNELISNSLKYAFPDDRKGEITVKMKKSNGKLELTVMDDGVGFPKDMDWRNTNSLGLKLVRSLAEDQLGGSIEMESKNGIKFTIKFNIET